MNKLEYLYYLKEQQQKKVNDVFEDKRQKKASLQNIKRLEKAIKTIKKKENKKNEYKNNKKRNNKKF